MLYHREKTLENSVYPTHYLKSQAKNDLQPIVFKGQGLLLGETVFTSFRTYFGKVPFLGDHIKRLEMGAQFLFQQNLKKEEIHLGIKGLLEKNLKENLRIRITLFKSHNDLDFLISVYPLENQDREAIKLSKAFKVRTPGLIPSFLKLGNYAEINLELKRALENGFDDIIFLDYQNLVTECSTSNIFAVKGDNIFTPAVNDLFLAGITRKKIIEMMLEKKIKVSEISLDFNSLLESDEIFICNSVKGIRSVGRVQDKLFSKNLITKEIIYLFNKFIGENCE